MRRPARSPWVSLALFLIVCSMGWVTWEHRRDLRWEEEERPLDAVLRVRVESMVLDEFEREACFVELRGHLDWRPSERRYRLDIVLDEGQACEDGARDLCRRMASRIQEEADTSATVIAYDQAGRELGRCVL